MKTCYTVVARLKNKTTHACHEKSYEILADSTAEAEDLVMVKHHRDWEQDKEHVFDGIQAVFPCTV